MKHLLMSAAFVFGAGAIAVAPATAATYTTSGDVTIFNSDGTNTYLDPSADLGSVLNGNSGAPGGNVELNDGAANANLNAPANTLTANLDSGRVVTFSSLTSDDWFGSGNLAQQWFGEAMGVYGTTIRTRFEGYLVSQGYSQQQAQFAASDDNNIFAAFNNQGGFARLSDPNIAYVNESAAGVTFGLAAHSDAGNVNPLLAGLYASEVVKVSLNGETEYYYSFDVPGVSGQTSRDGTNSHEGNYEFFIADPQNEESVPEPAAILGLVAVGGVLVAKRKQQAA